MGFLSDVGKKFNRTVKSAGNIVVGVGTGKSFSSWKDGSNLLRDFGSALDPVGINPLGSFTADFFADWMDPNALKGENDMNRLFKQFGKKDWMPGPLNPEGKARMQGFKNALDSINRRKASQTLFTSGMGAQGSPNVLTSSLLGL
jgi:hypothetical protein